MTTHADRVNRFNTLLKASLDMTIDRLQANEQWEHIKTTTRTAAMTPFGKKRAQRNKWYPAYDGKLDPLLETKHLALQDFKESPSAKLQQTLRRARSSEDGPKV